jgi:protein-S-isoprenylcysteine O-methyltransferase Ste14
MRLPVRIALALLGSAAYFALAILGWGGASALFSHPPLVALAIVLAVLAVASIFAGGNLSPGVREDRGNRWIIVVIGLIGLMLGFLPAFADRMEFLTIDGDAARWMGVVLFGAGGLLRLWRVCLLKKETSHGTTQTACYPGRRS